MILIMVQTCIYPLHHMHMHAGESVFKQVEELPARLQAALGFIQVGKSLLTILVLIRPVLLMF